MLLAPLIIPETNSSWFGVESRASKGFFSEIPSDSSK